MAPEGHSMGCNFSNDRVASYANCHRFISFFHNRKTFRYDQSAINIILLPYPLTHVGYPANGYLWTFRGYESPEQPVICDMANLENQSPVLKNK